MNLTNIEHVTNLLLRVFSRFVQTSDFGDFLRGESAISIEFTGSLMFFFDSILRVFFRSTNPQMFWIDTKWDIARVAHRKATRYFLFMQFIRVTMRAFLPPRSYPKVAVPTPRLATSPKPTAVGYFLYESEKTYLWWGAQAFSPRASFIAHKYMIP